MTRRLVHTSLRTWLAMAALGLCFPQAWAGKTLDAVKQRGEVVCGVITGLAGFGAADSQGKWSGLDVDVCRAVAAAVLGDANKVRFVTAASLFDGHDASINIMRRILMSQGAEVLHLGHNRSVDEIVTAALQEDAQGIAISSYQGGHVEYFKYMIDLLKQRGGAHIKVYGGGGGVIVPSEIKDLHD